MSRVTVTSITRCAISPVTASCPASHSMTSTRASASRSRRPSATHSISCCGRRQKKASPHGRAPGDRAVRDGTSSARRCRAQSWAGISTFMAAARTCSFRIMRTRSRSPKGHLTKLAQTLSSITGCTTDSCASTTKRCRNRSATSLPCAKYSPSTTPKSCVFSSCVRTTAARSITPTSISTMRANRSRVSIRRSRPSRSRPALSIGAIRPPRAFAT